MPLSGTGMLITVMDIAPEEDLDYHRWYDKEHFAERVGIEGFLEARRYDAIEGAPRYLHLYTTETFETLDGPAYRKALQNQSAWSLHHIPKFRNPTRVCGRVAASRGQGRGGTVAFIRIRPQEGSAEGLRAAILERFDVLYRPGILSVHLIEGDAELSTPLTPTAQTVGSADWYVIVDGTRPEAVKEAAASRFTSLPDGAVISCGVYRHLADLAKAELDTWTPRNTL
jgi:hypothetical protein